MTNGTTPLNIATVLRWLKAFRQLPNLCLQALCLYPHFILQARQQLHDKWQIFFQLFWTPILVTTLSIFFRLNILSHVFKCFLSVVFFLSLFFLNLFLSFSIQAISYFLFPCFSSVFGEALSPLEQWQFFKAKGVFCLFL